jgi:Skp family chaperone for outer membrane proteins
LIGWVDFSRAIEVSRTGNAALLDLRKLAVGMQQKVDEDKKAIRAQQEKLNEERATLPPAEIEKRLRELQAKAVQLQEQFQTAQKSLQSEELRVTADLTKRMKGYAADLAKKHGMTYVLSGNAVVVGDPAGDLTDQLVKMLDETLVPEPK